MSLLWVGTTVFAGSELIRFGFASMEPDQWDENEDTPEPSTEVDSENNGVLFQTDTSLGLSLGAFTLSIAGRFVPVMGLLSLPLLVAGILPTATAAGSKLVRDKRFDFEGLSTLGAVLEIGLGYELLASFSWMVFAAGKRLQQRTRSRLIGELENAIEDLGERAWVTRDGVEVEVPLRTIRLDDHVIVRTGDLLPVDGYIVDGSVVVDEHILAGNTRLLHRDVGDELLATTMVMSGTARLRPSRTGGETVAARVSELRERSVSYEQRLHARALREGNRSIRSTLAMMTLGLATGGLPASLAGFWTNGVELSWFGAPYLVMNTIQAAAAGSVLIKDGRSLEQLSAIDTVVLSKTGTLHTFELGSVHVETGTSEHEALRLAAALERGHHHPIARAIITAATDAQLEIPAPERPSSQVVGFGLRGAVDGHELTLGGAHMLIDSEFDLNFDADRSEQFAAAEARGHSLVHLVVDGRWCAALELIPRLRPGISAALEHLRERGLDLFLLSGDSPSACAALASSLDLEPIHGRALPERKHELIRELQAQGRRVCFVGDGPTDGLALQSANVSIALAGASPIAVNSAQILLQAGSLSQLDGLFGLNASFETKQRVVIAIGRGTTVTSGLSFLVLGASLPILVWFYSLGLLAILVISSFPQLGSERGKSLTPNAAKA